MIEEFQDRSTNIFNIYQINTIVGLGSKGTKICNDISQKMYHFERYSKKGRSPYKQNCKPQNFRKLN